MSPYQVRVERWPGQQDRPTALVVAYVWADAEARAIVIWPDRTLSAHPIEDLELVSISPDMPAAFFDWPEVAS